MAKEIQNIKKFKILEMTSKEFYSTGGFSICDSCSKKMDKGYFIPVLNMSYCTEHYLKWFKDAFRYPEDIPFEEYKFTQMKTFLNNTKAD